MTVSNVTNRTSATGSGSSGQVVSFSFPITATSDLDVIKRVTATGVETTLAETTNYTVVITGTTGGTVTTVTTIETTEEIHIIRDTPKTQALDLEQGGAFNAENIESALDKNTKLAIDNDDAITRSLRAPTTDSTVLDLEIPNSIDRASKSLTFDASGNVTATAAATTTVAFSDFGETLVDDANAAAARTTLGAQASNANLTTLAGLAVANSNFIVGDGTNWVVETGATARTSMGVTSTLWKHTLTAVTTGRAVTSAELEGNTTLTNAGAGAGVEFALPAGATNNKVSFMVAATQTLSIQPNGNELIIDGFETTNATKNMSAATIGYSVTITWNGTKWSITERIGIWDIEA